MNKLQTATKLIIEALHGKNFGRAIGFEKLVQEEGSNFWEWECYPICASRLMQALNNKIVEFENFGEYEAGDLLMMMNDGHCPYISFDTDKRVIIEWITLKDNYQAATLENQSEETLDKIIEIFTYDEARNLYNLKT